jgi:hypothetical protein
MADTFEHLGEEIDISMENGGFFGYTNPGMME